MLSRLQSRLAALRGLRADMAALGLGALAAAALPPFHVIPVLLVSVPGLLVLLDAARSPAVAARRGWWFGLGHHVLGLYWVTEAILFEAARFWWLVPLAVPALAAALALSIAPRTIETVGRVREAQELRGIRTSRLRSLPALAVPVLATGMEEAVTLAESMDARGHGRGRRSRYRPERWTGPAIVVAAAAAAGAGVFASAWLGGPGGDGLQPSTFPLLWPAADPVLLAAIALLAVPGLSRRGVERP